MLRMVLKARNPWPSVLANAVLSYREGGVVPFRYRLSAGVLLRWLGHAPDEVGVVCRIALEESGWHHDNRLLIWTGLQ